jgi:hypothetical protein
VTVKNLQNAYLLLESDTRQRLEFQFMPERITDAKGVSWHSQSIVGRSEPYISYDSSGSRVFTFDLKFTASVDAGDDGRPEEVVRKVNWLRALQYPEVANGLVLGPSVCWFIVGYNWIASRVVCAQATPSYEGPWNGNEFPRVVLGPLSATVSLSLLEVNLVPREAATVRAGLERTASDFAGPLIPG